MSRIFTAAALAAWAAFLPPDALATYDVPPGHWEESLAAADTTAFIAEDDDIAIGFAVVAASRDADADPTRTGLLDDYFVVPSAWHRGVGRALMAAAIDTLADRDFDDATLWTAEQNERARRTYEAAGWRLDGATRRKTTVGVEYTELRYRIRLTA